jgi:guanylate kinase
LIRARGFAISVHGRNTSPYRRPPAPARSDVHPLQPLGRGQDQHRARHSGKRRRDQPSISATTRAPRPGEVDGKDYYFVSQPEFDRMAEENEFYEWAHVFGKSYGTPKAAIREALKQGRDFLFDIDWQGTQQLSQKAGTDVVRVFILPPSLDELQRRLIGRGTDSEKIIASRMARAQAEISHWDSYDYVVVNEDFDACLQEVRQILCAER